MTTDREQWADSLTGEHSGGWLSGFLAEEDELDRRALWRLGSWGIGSITAVVLALYANQTGSGLRREQVASVDLARQAQQIQWIAKESQNETRRLASAIDTLNSDRDRLYSRVAVVEQGLDSVTGSVKQNAAASPPTTSGPTNSTPSTSTPSTSASTSSNSTPSPSTPSTSTSSTSMSSTASPSTSGSTTVQPTTSDRATTAPQAPPPTATATNSKTGTPGTTGPVTASATPTTTPTTAPTTPPPTTAGPTTATVAPTTPQNGAILSGGPPLTQAPTTTVAATTAPERLGAIGSLPPPQLPSTPQLLQSPPSQPSTTAARTEPANSVATGQLAALMPPKSIMAPPDPAATKLTEPEKPATTAPTGAPPQKVDTTPAATEPEAAEKDEAPAIPVQRTQFGVDLGGANSVDGLRALWRGLLKYRANQALADLQPLIVVKERSNGLGMQLRLVAGPLGDAAAAAKICAGLTDNSRSCETTVFDGQRLAMVKSDTGSGGESSKSETSAVPTVAPADRDRAASSSRSSHRRSGSKRTRTDDVSEKDTSKPPAPRSALTQFLGLR